MENCDKLLENGLYAITKMTNTGSFNKDLKTYYLSEQFKTDFQNGKWGNSVTLPIDGVPFTLGIDYSQEQYHEFKSKLLQIEELNISSEYTNTVFKSIPNTNLYNAYNTCMGIVNQAIGFSEGPNIETEDTVVFNIRYRPQAAGDALPIVQNFSVIPEGSILNGALTVGQTIDFETTVTCKRWEERDTILSLDTDRGTFVSKSASEGSLSSAAELPVGTVLNSFLTFSQFSFTTRNNEKSPGNLWTAQKSRYAPCDGRSVPNSKYAKITSQITVPDLRGLFFRGGNNFDSEYAVQPQNPAQLNPDNLAIGILQLDAFAGHDHNFRDPGHYHMSRVPGGVGSSGVPGNPQGLVPEKTSVEYTGINFEMQGAAETRPKNVSVFYYIRIN